MNIKLTKLIYFLIGKQTGYFKKSELKAIYYITKPEIGFTSNRVYISNNNQIEKVIYRTCLPDFSEKANDYKLVDSIFEIYPNTNQIIRYFDNKVIDTIEDVNRIKLILKQISSYKTTIEDHHNGI